MYTLNAVDLKTGLLFSRGEITLAKCVCDNSKKKSLIGMWFQGELD